MISIQCVQGGAAQNYIQDIGRLRIEVFREFPYLYDGDFSFEEKYLASYFSCPDSLVVLALDNSKIIGASTGLPLKSAEIEWRKAFTGSAYNIDSVFYFGESVLQKNYRGRGLGHIFFDEREKFAREQIGIRFTSFCSVVRSPDHPLRPPEFRSYKKFWQKRGYAKIPNLTTHFQWKDVGDSAETAKKMEFWIRELHGLGANEKG